MHSKSRPHRFWRNVHFRWPLVYRLRHLHAHLKQGLVYMTLVYICSLKPDIQADVKHTTLDNLKFAAKFAAFFTKFPSCLWKISDALTRLTRRLVWPPRCLEKLPTTHLFAICSSPQPFHSTYDRNRGALIISPTIRKQLTDLLTESDNKTNQNWIRTGSIISQRSDRCRQRSYIVTTPTSEVPS